MARHLKDRPLSVSDPPPTAYRPVVLAAAAACAGICVDRFLVTPLEIPASVLWWLTSAAALTAACLWLRRPRRGDGSVLLLIAVAALFGGWAHLRWNYFPADDLARFAGDEPHAVCLQATLMEPVELRPAPAADPLRAVQLGPASSTSVEVHAIRDGATWRPVSGVSRLRVVGRLAGVGPGDRVQLFAQLARPLPAANPGQFDWGAAQRGRRRCCELYCRDPACLTPLAQPTSAPAAALAKVRAWCRRQLAESVGPTSDDLALAVLLGAREQLTDATTQAFMLTGAIHLLVISGMHVGMLAATAWATMRLLRVPRAWGLALTGAAVIVYATIVGPRPPVIRATLLVLLMLAAWGVRRKASPMQLLAAAALVVMAVNPSELFRSGTQLSFLSVAVLVRFGQFVSRPRPPDPLRRLLVEAAPWYARAVRSVAVRAGLLAAASSLVWAAAAPLVAYHFHLSTPGGIIVSPLAWPLVALAIAAGAGILTLGIIVPPAAWLLGAVCAGSLQLTQQIVAVAHQVEGGRFYCAGPPAWWLFGLYGAAALFAGVAWLRPHWPRLTALATLWIIVGWFVSGQTRVPPGQLRCTFLAMGHGTCAVLEFPNGQTLLYDAGSLGAPDAASRAIASYLWSRGIAHVDAIVLSHADVDHYNAVPGLLEMFSVGAIYVSPQMFAAADDRASQGPAHLQQVVEVQGVPLRQTWQHGRIEDFGEQVKMRILHPPAQGVAGRDNANSLILLVEFAGRRILLPGDLESPGMEQVTQAHPLDVDVLLAPHHGSAGSDPPGFAAWCTPEWVVVSGQRPSRTAVANHSYREAGAEVVHTAESGAAEFVLTARAVRARTHRARASR